MANTRDFKSLGIWGVDADDPPENPRGGTPYRNTALTQEENEAGEPYGDPSISADFNQKMFIVTSILDTLDTHGTLGWYDQIDYAVPALVYASDSNFYQALRVSGPSNGGAIDPTSDDLTNPAWQFVESSQILRKDLSNKSITTSGSTLVGYNKSIINGGENEPLTVKNSLDELYDIQNALQGLRLIGSGYFQTDPDNQRSIIVGNTGYNIRNNEAVWLPRTPIGNSPHRIQLLDFTGDTSTLLQFVTFAASPTTGQLTPVVGLFEPLGFIDGFATIDIYSVSIVDNFPIRTNFSLQLFART